MAGTLIVSYSKELIEKAKTINVQPQMFINQNVNQLAIRYKKMAPIIVAGRMEKYLSIPMDAYSKQELEGCIGDLKTAHEFGITAGEFRMIKLGVQQDKGKVNRLSIQRIFISTSSFI